MGPSEGLDGLRRHLDGQPRLVTPDVAYHASVLAALEEYHAEGRHQELSGELLRDPEVFARYVEALQAGVERPCEPDFFVAALSGTPLPEPPKGGYVPQTTLWWVRRDEYLGRISIRHHLNEGLLREGGNLGYEVRPAERRRGHATAMLAAALPVAADLGIEVAHVDCAVGNTASRRVIEKNGGRLEREEDGNLYFLVPTAPRP